MYNVSFLCCFAVRLLRKKGVLGGETLLMADCKHQKAPNRELVLFFVFFSEMCLDYHEIPQPFWCIHELHNLTVI